MVWQGRAVYVLPCYLQCLFCVLCVAVEQENEGTIVIFLFHTATQNYDSFFRAVVRSRESHT